MAEDWEIWLFLACRDLSGNGMTHLLAPKHPRRRRGDDEATGTRTRARGEKRESRVDAGVDGAEPRRPRDLRTPHSNQQAISAATKTRHRSSAMTLKIFVLLLSITATTSNNQPPLMSQLSQLRSLLDEIQSSGSTASTHELQSLAPKLRKAAQAALNSRDENGLTRVHHAVIEQDLERLGSLLDLGLDQDDAAGELRVRPLHLAVLAGDGKLDCLDKLLDAGASPDLADANGTTALHAASTLNLPNVASRLLDAGASVDRRGAKGVRALQLAAWSNAAEAAEVLLDRGANPDATDKRRRTACHAASASDSAEALEVLLDHKASPQKADGKGRTPLHYAVRACSCSDPRCPKVRTVQLLLEAGAKTETEDSAGWSAVDVAAELNRVAPLQMLLSSGASANRCGSAGCPPLTLAAHSGAREGVAILLAAGAAIDARDANGASAAMAAAVGAHQRTLKLLLQAGAPITATDDAGRTCAHYAAKSDSAPCLRALRKAGVDLGAETTFGWTPVHVAANHSCASAMAMLLQSGKCPVDVRDTAGWSPLHLATHRLGQGTEGCRCRACRKLHRDRRQCMRLLLRHGASTDTVDQRHATPAHLAAAHDDDEGLRMLRAYGAKLWDREDDDGQTPLRLARRLHKPSRFVKTMLMLPDVVEMLPQPSEQEMELDDEDRP